MVLPKAFVNTVEVRGQLSVSNVLSAICAGYEAGTVPKICDQFAANKDVTAFVQKGGESGSADSSGSSEMTEESLASEEDAGRTCVMKSLRSTCPLKTKTNPAEPLEDPWTLPHVEEPPPSSRPIESREHHANKEKFHNDKHNWVPIWNHGVLFDHVVAYWSICVL